MCLTGGDIAAARVYNRLVTNGVPEHRAAGIARKVRRAYDAKAASRRAAAIAGAESIVRTSAELRSTTTSDEHGGT